MPQPPVHRKIASQTQLLVLLFLSFIPTPNQYTFGQSPTPKLLGNWLSTTTNTQTHSFDGRTQSFQTPNSDRIALGTQPFTLALTVDVDEDFGDSLGDIVSLYDPAHRRGFNLGIYNHNGVTNSQPNSRQLHFGIDNGQADNDFIDHGRLGDAVYIFSLCVHNGKLYAATCHAGPNQTGRVFRYETLDRWTDLGSPDQANAISALAVFDGQLYAASSKYRLAGSSLSESENKNFGGKVFRLSPDDTWEDCGSVSPETQAIAALTVFRGKLYASSLYQPAGFFRYEGNQQWTPCNTPNGKRTEALCVFNDALYATCYDQGSIFRFDGQNWTNVGTLPDATQTYGLAIHQGDLYVSEWPNAHVYRYRADNDWVNTGRLGQELEAMPLLVYNGKMYGGTLPLAEIYRFDGDQQWTRIGRVDFTPDVKYRRAWSMAVYQGRLFVGTLPSGHVLSIEAGKNATHDYPIQPGRHDILAVRGEQNLKLYLDGKLVATSAKFNPQDYDLSLDQPMNIGFGAQDHFRGAISNVRLYSGEWTPEQLAPSTK
jgi:outer membrane protein assembly factor BamB